MTEPNPGTKHLMTLALGRTGSHVTRHRHARFATQALNLALLAHLIFGLIFLVLMLWPMVLASIVSMGAYSACIWLTQRGKIQAMNLLVSTTLLGHALFASVMLGRDAGFLLYAWILLPLVAINSAAGVQQKLVRGVIYISVLIAIELWLHKLTAHIVLPESTTEILNSINLAAYLGITGTLTFFYARMAADAEQRLHKHATTDTLTGLDNRRNLLECAKQEWLRAERSGAPLSVIITDLDRFKTINDSYGHPCGDAVLISVAQCLRRVVRPQDRIARWGGEEFLILLPEMDYSQALSAAEHCRQAIQDLRIPSAVGPIHISASFGITQWRANDSFERCVARADKALYTAKQAGRNQVQGHEQTLTEAQTEQLLQETAASSAHQLTQAVQRIPRRSPS